MKKKVLVLVCIIAVAAFLEIRREERNLGNAGAEKMEIPQTPDLRFSSEFPDRTCPIDRYGGKNDGKTKNTEAFRKAIDDCERNGGGTVLIPPGKWLTGPIHLKSGIHLHLDEHAEVIFSQTFADYLPVVFSRYEGMELFNYSPLVYARDCHDVSITGSGIFDGQGSAWWDWKAGQQAGAEKLHNMAFSGEPVENRIFGNETDMLRPSFMQFIDCSRVSLEGFTIRNGPMWTIHPVYSSEIFMRGLSIHTEGVNNDGIVVDSSEKVLIEDVSLDTEDDAIAIKSGLDEDGRRIGRPSQDIVIRNCHVGRGNGGIVIGSEMSGDVRNVFVSNCEFSGTKRGIRMKSMKGRGGTVENIFVDGIRMKDIEKEAILFDMFYESKNVIDPKTDLLPTFRNISLRNIEVDGTKDPITLLGLPENPIKNIILEDIHIDGKNNAVLKNVSDVTMKNLTVRASNGKPFDFENITNLLFNRSDIRKSFKRIENESISL